MIYDCFSFFNELDLLEIRLNVLKDVVDKFVLVEATQTHAGQSKPLYYQENAGRFSAFGDRIIHIVVSDFSGAEGANTARERAWAVENIQRNAIALGLKEAQESDTILISDLDEIPNPEVLVEVVGKSGLTRLGLMPCYYYLNFRNYSLPEWTLSTQVLSYRTFCDPRTYRNFRFNEFVIPSVNRIPSASMIRFSKSDRTVHDAGWHFSYQGGAKMICRKIQSIAHTEFDTENTHSEVWVEERIKKGEDVFLRGDRFFAEKLDERFPSYVRDHVDRYAHMIFPVDDSYLSQIAFARARAFINGRIRAFVIGLIPDALVPFCVKIRNALLRI